MTRKELLMEMVNGTAAQEEIAEFATLELEKMEKAAERRRSRVSKARQENEALLLEMQSRMDADSIYTTAHFEDMGLTTQKVSSLLRTLVDEGVAVKVDKVKVEKRKLQGYKLA